MARGTPNSLTDRTAIRYSPSAEPVRVAPASRQSKVGLSTRSARTRNGVGDGAVSRWGAGAEASELALAQFGGCCRRLAFPLINLTYLLADDQLL